VATTQAGTRADLSGDFVLDFQTTMDMPFMTVADPGNTGELSGGTAGFGLGRVCGAVDYTYNIGKFEVTAGQYAEFLNAVAATDTYDLYTGDMAFYGPGCQIQRSGSSGSYAYSVAAEYADRPANFITWFDAARFANWLTNGMPTGAQGLDTTESGSYYLDGAMTFQEINGLTRQAGARYVIPSEDEWYKAAYYDPALNGGAGGYYDYGTSTDALPGWDKTDPDSGNNANWELGSGQTTEVGEFESSDSPYGLFDTAGNVWEWHEVVVYGQARGRRGGSFEDLVVNPMAAYTRHASDPAFEYYTHGFRIAEVPEPMTLGLLSLGGIALIRRRKP